MASSLSAPAGCTRIPVAAAVWLFLAAAAHAQPATTLAPVTITGRGEPAAGVGGWSDVPLSRAPFSAAILERERLLESGTQRVADIARIDPTVREAYSAEGYWDIIAVRGFPIDNRFNYRRDGLPVNAETRIPLDNKDRLEVLRGISGLQSGVSAPGGLVNHVVKRPLEASLRQALVEWRQRGSVLGHVDIGERIGADRAFGLRVNAAAERIDPRVRDARGDRHLLGVAGDWRIAPDTLLEAEVEQSRHSQPSVPGFSMLGDVVPDAHGVDPRINLNNQPWSLPVVFDNATASLRFTQRLSAQWRWSAHAMTQRLKSDDRIAFPFGCGAEGRFDRYCSDGTFDLYDFRSENERRRTHALQLAVNGELQTGPVTHALGAGVLGTRFRGRFEPQVFEFAGTGNVQGTAVVPPNPVRIDPIADRDERSTEVFVQDAARLGATTAWLGVRHTRLEREAADTPTFTKNVATPWLALSREWGNGQVVYASWGQGIETAVVPNLRDLYGDQAGRPLEPLKSRQAEIGAKGAVGALAWSAALFDIRRPATSDIELDASGARRFFVDGTARHRGVEGAAAWRSGPWWLQGGLQWLQARREGSVDPGVNGKRPTNVPAAVLTLYARHDIAALPGLAVHAGLLAESSRMVLPDNSARIPGHARVDTGLRWRQSTGAGTLVWRAGVDNLFDRRAWREAPFQFAHVYLFPEAPRTFRVSLEALL